MFSIRTATMADVDLLTTIEAESFPPEEKATRESFEKRLAVFADDFLILEADGKAVGLIDGMITDSPTITDEMYEDASLHNSKGRWQSVFGLAVLPECRRRGYASALMRAFIEKARMEGREGVILCCKEALIPFYQSFGFASMGVSASVHGGAVWYDMTLRLRPGKDEDGAH